MLRDAPPRPKTEAELRARIERRRALNMTAANPTSGWKELAGAFRETGRRLLAGKMSNNGALTLFLMVRSNDRPIEGAQLQKLLCAAESHEARGDRAAAIEHIQAAIDLSLAMAGRAGKPVEPKQESPGEEYLRIEAGMPRDAAPEQN